MWQPWVGHWFRLGPSDMADLSLSQYVGMWEFASKQAGS